MGEDFNTDSMLDMFLYESEQLLENLQNVVLERRTVLMRRPSMKFSASCIRSKDLRVL